MFRCHCHHCREYRQDPRNRYRIDKVVVAFAVSVLLVYVLMGVAAYELFLD